jgi:hypothetical protein
MKRDELQVLLSTVGDAIRDSDHQKLYEIISTVSDGVSGIEESDDVFIERRDAEGYEVLPLSRQTKLN